MRQFFSQLIWQNSMTETVWNGPTKAEKWRTWVKPKLEDNLEQNQRQPLHTSWFNTARNPQNSKTLQGLRGCVVL